MYWLDELKQELALATLYLIAFFPMTVVLIGGIYTHCRFARYNITPSSEWAIGALIVVLIAAVNEVWCIHRVNQIIYEEL